MGSRSYGVLSGGSEEVYPLVESLGSYSGAEGGSFGEISVWGSLGSKYGSELGSSGEMLGGQVGSSEIVSRYHGYGKREGSPLVNILGGFSNGKSDGNIGGNTLGGVLSVNSGMII